MSRIGKKPIDIPSGVTVTIDGNTIGIKGPKGELQMDLHPMIQVAVEDSRVLVSQKDTSVGAGKFHGLCRSLVANMVEGVNNGFQKDLVIEGVGYKAEVQGSKMILTLGFASPKEYVLPDGVVAEVAGGTNITVTGCDKQKVGQAAAMIRSYYPVEPYKGKGIRYKDERVRRKVGKTVA